MARNIRRLSVARQISQDAFAANTGVDCVYVSRLETGSENPGILLLEADRGGAGRGDRGAVR